ncbi:hypothetical protein SAMN04515674_112128 [Pseudarcicella hirudinis]|uniref:Uncharacterized protein n=1 Tax=Pseudarcicella hirudinis TaxID=1079859 RepID=A0A1I5WS13_9BACT|nr:hypothetical protein [Pseudarcicella hirudinis]SFQ22236.1 hypothetical protein SAMN04515674_112128 [Pseudarcicella hirudinis]
MKPYLLKYITYIVAAFPAGFFIWYVGRYTVNIPFLDDNLYYTDCILAVNKSKSIAEAFWIFMKQHTITEHRTPVSKFVAYLIYKFTGSLNYTILAHLGNLFLGGLLFFFWKVFQKTKTDFVFFLPIPFLIFQMQTFENQFWTICNWTYYPIGFLQMLTLYLLSFDKPRYFLWAILSAILVTFTFSNGMFVFLPAALVLIYLKRYKECGIMTVTGALCVALYFSTYKPSPIVPHQLDIVHLFTSFVILLGSYLEIQSASFLSNTTAFLFGALVLTGLIYTCFALLNNYFDFKNRYFPIKFKKNYRANLFLSSSVICLLISAAAVAYSRSASQDGYYEMFFSRYKFISVLLLCLAYFFCLINFSGMIKKAALWVFLPFSIFMYFFSYYWNHETIFNMRENLFVGMFNFQNNKALSFYPHGNDWAESIDKITEEAIKTQVYKSPETIYTKFSKEILSASGPVSDTTVFQISRKDNHWLIKNETFPVETSVDEGMCLILKSEKKTYLLPFRRERNKSRKDLVKNGNYFWKGFEVKFDDYTYLPGKYSVGIIRIIDNQFMVSFHKSLIIDK